MAAKKFSKADIIDVLHDKTGLERREIHTVVDLFTSEIKTALLQRYVIELRGFGTFEVKIRKARARARNPRTGQTISVRPRGQVIFRPGRELKQNAWTITDEDTIEQNQAPS